MPFEVATRMDRRREFVLLASEAGANVRALCRRFGITPNTAYTWLARYRAEGEAGLADRSRRPHISPRQTTPADEAAVLAVRAKHPTWGGRKIRAWLQAHERPTPAASTITAILDRHDLLTGPRAGEPRAYLRFEHPVPNALWQMDFMGHKGMAHGRVHPLTVLDDHSRFALGLVACPHEQGALVQTHLTTIFQAYGLPQAILTDNGPAWGRSRPGVLTRLEVWLLRLGVGVWHGRYRHPQTQGKIERWHGTIATDVFQFQVFPDLAAAQVAFDAYRDEYNTDRPHEAIGLAVPITRYRISERCFPDSLPEIVYSDDHSVQTVTGGGWVWFGKRRIELGEALRGLPVGIRPTAVDGVFVVRFCDHAIKRIDLRQQA
jgi:transposase InsO family protein